MTITIISRISTHIFKKRKKEKPIMKKLRSYYTATRCHVGASHQSPLEIGAFRAFLCEILNY